MWVAYAAVDLVSVPAGRVSQDLIVVLADM